MPVCYCEWKKQLAAMLAWARQEAFQLMCNSVKCLTSQAFIPSAGF